MGPFHWHGITLIPVRISNYIHYKMWYETSIPKLVRSHRWSSGMDKQLHTTFYRGFLVTSHSLPLVLCERILQTPSNDAIDSSPWCPTFWKLCSSAIVLSQRHVFFATQSNVFVKSRGGFRCVTFYSDIALHHVCMHNVTQFSQRHVIFRNATYCRNVFSPRNVPFSLRHIAGFLASRFMKVRTTSRNFSQCHVFRCVTLPVSLGHVLANVISFGLP